MKHFNFKSIALATALVGGIALSANAEYQVDPNSLYGRQLFKVHTGRQYKGEVPFVNEGLFQGSDLQKDLIAAKRITPDQTFRSVNGVDYMNGPNGTTWFYTMNLTQSRVLVKTAEENGGYELWENVISGFTFSIYNEMYERIGSISDEITLDNSDPRVTEKKAIDIWIDPAVSQHFFNSDDNYEVMVFHAINTILEGIKDSEGLNQPSQYAYVNRYYQKVYSINGEKDEKTGMDKCIKKIEGRCIDATNVKAGQGEEEFYYTFIKDGVPDFWSYRVDPYDDGYVEHVKSLISPLTVYKTTADGNDIEPLLVYELGNARVPHDTTDGIYLITKVQDGKGYFTFSQYEKPLMVNPLGGALDESLTPDNNLVISAYNLSNGEINKISDTKIPCRYFNPSNGEQLMYAFYSIGNVTYRDDVDISGALGTPEAPAYIVTHEECPAADLNSVTSWYEVYDNQGTFKHFIAEDIENMQILGTTEDGPLALFVKLDELEQYHFEINSLYKNEIIADIKQSNGGGYEGLTASCALYRPQDGSDYQYAFVMQYWDPTDANGNDYARVQYLTKDGKKDHIDRINLGQGVQMAQIYMVSSVLNPYLYDDDDAMEYAVLVARTYGDTAREEFIIVDDSGKWYGQFSADDGHGSPRLYDIIPGGGDVPNRLMMMYEDGAVDIYNLPFDQSEAYEPSGVGSIFEDAVSGEATTLAPARYFNLQGIEVKNPAKGEIFIKQQGDKTVKAIER